MVVVAAEAAAAVAVTEKKRAANVLLKVVEGRVVQFSGQGPQKLLVVVAVMEK